MPVEDRARREWGHQRMKRGKDKPHSNIGIGNTWSVSNKERVFSRICKEDAVLYADSSAKVGGTESFHTFLQLCGSSANWVQVWPFTNFKFHFWPVRYPSTYFSLNMTQRLDNFQSTSTHHRQIGVQVEQHRALITPWRQQNWGRWSQSTKTTVSLESSSNLSKSLCIVTVA